MTSTIRIKTSAPDWKTVGGIIKSRYETVGGKKYTTTTAIDAILKTFKAQGTVPVVSYFEGYVEIKATT